MHAVIKTGGKQYRVAIGDKLAVESLPVEPGQTYEFDSVLMITSGDTVTIGQPLVPGARVVATVLENGRHPKVRIIKFRRRKHHRKQMGHRQNFTKVEINEIVGA